MCFSETASFTAAAVLSGVGAVTLGNVRHKREIPLAMIPLLFGIQQFLEGMQWLGVSSNAPSTAIGYAFLAFAFVLWPSYFPWVIRLVEPAGEGWRKKLLTACMGIGGTVSFILLMTLILQPLSIIVHGDHILYAIPYLVNVPDPIGVIPYVFAVCGSPLLSSHRMIRWFGLAMFLALVIAWWLSTIAFASIWCIFAAVLSVMVYLHFKTHLPKGKRIELNISVEKF